VQPCDVNDSAIFTTGDIVDQLQQCRQQRNSCSATVDGLREWREGAVKRNAQNPEVDDGR